jgi:hypothetical protein
MGGYIQGGGHSPMSSVYGTGSDQVLAFEVVTSDGQFITADAEQNTDLFWALRGGGGGTFGVVTSVTVKAHPDVSTTVAKFKFTTAGISDKAFWAGLRAYFDYFIPNADAETYAYFLILPNYPEADVISFHLTGAVAPNKTVDEFLALLDPWFSQLKGLGIIFEPNITHWDSYYPAWFNNFPREPVEETNVAIGSRLFPRRNFLNPLLLNATFEAVRLSATTGHRVYGFNMKNVSPGDPENAVNPAWRDNVFFAIQALQWPLNATAEEIWEARRGFTFGDMQRWRDITPGAGSYLGESDRLEPDFQQSLYGNKYGRLLDLKRKYDPTDLFYAATAVGSEDWHVQSVDGLPNENGKLCRAEAV